MTTNVSQTEPNLDDPSTHRAAARRAIADAPEPHAPPAAPRATGKHEEDPGPSDVALSDAGFAEAVPEQAVDETHEPRFLILIHNDDVTPFEYVLNILGRVFLLSEELAEHVAWTAHSEGVAVVMVRPLDEAKRLVAVATSRARMDGYPLTFSVEPER